MGEHGSSRANIVVWPSADSTGNRCIRASAGNDHGGRNNGQPLGSGEPETGENVADRTGDIYQRHHETGRYGFTIGGDERGQWFAQEIAQVAQRLGKGRLRVLDMGCRDGTLTSHYSGSHELFGVDVDPEAVRRSRERGIDARKLNLNEEDLPFEDAMFDVVVAGEVLEHLQWPQHAVDQVHRVLRPGGTFIGSVPNAFRLRNRILFLAGRDFELDPTHLHSFSPQGLRTMLSAFERVTLEFHGGRRRNIHPQLMASQMHWRAFKSGA
jgi:SAM-dependent methyltransferase